MPSLYLPFYLFLQHGCIHISISKAAHSQIHTTTQTLIHQNVPILPSLLPIYQYLYSLYVYSWTIDYFFDLLILKRKGENIFCNVFITSPPYTKSGYSYVHRVIWYACCCYYYNYIFCWQVHFLYHHYSYYLAVTYAKQVILLDD